MNVLSFSLFGSGIGVLMEGVYPPCEVAEYL